MAVVPEYNIVKSCSSQEDDQKIFEIQQQIYYSVSIFLLKLHIFGIHQAFLLR